MKKRNWRLMLRRVLNLVFSRIVVTGVLLLLQAFWLFALFYWLADYAKWFGGVGVAMSIIMCLALIRQDSTVPEFKISWMILFAVMPVQGGILYLLWGNKRPALGLRHRLERAEDAMAPARKDDPDAAAALQRQDPRAALTARYLHDYGPMPVCGGTAAKYYPDGQSMFADMLPALQGAQHSIYVESFIIGMGEMWGQIHEILRRKAAAGLDVRVIYDDAGCLSLLPHNYAEMMRADGIRAFSFNRCVPVLNLVMNNRDHRKIMVIDGQIAFTGGVNLADEYINKIVRFGYWKDSGVRLDGPGAASLANIFLTFWKAKYPDEDLDPFQTQQLQEALQAQEEALTALLRTSRRGRLLSQGLTCVLLGRPNAGKSSLLNALAGYERAIVTPIPGTTRDTVEATVTLEGYLFRLVDTAGLRDSDDPIEQLGVARSRQALDQADLILLVCDGTQELGEEDTALLDQALDQADTLLVMNKSDLPGYGCPMFRAENTAHTLSVVGLSAKTGLGLEFLEAELVRRAQALLPQAGQRASELLLTNQRQTDAVRRAAESVARAGQALEQGVTPDALLTDVEQAMAALGELTGRTVREDITSRIFQRFCVGK